MISWPREDGPKRAHLPAAKPNGKAADRAADAVEGKTTSGFVVSSALENAEETVQRHEIMALIREDAMRFFFDGRRRATGNSRNS